MKRYLIALLFSLWTSAALATVTCTLPFNLQNGTTADATQVMADYNALVACLAQAASAGANNDITSLSALSTPIPPGGGGSTLYAGNGTTGTGNAQIITTTTPSGFSPARGYTVVFAPTAANTGPVTLLVNNQRVASTSNPSCASSCPPVLLRETPLGPAVMTGGELQVGNMAVAVWDGSEFILANSIPQTGGYGPLTTIGSATTTDLGTAASHNIFVSPVNSPITGFGSSATTFYPVYRLFFGGSIDIVYNGTNMILIGGANIAAKVGDFAEMLYQGSGSWRMLSYTRANGTALVNPTSMSGAQGLLVTNDPSTPNTTIDVVADQAVLLATGPVPIYASSISVSINCTTTGANALDTGALAANNWYNVFLISNGSATAGLVSLSATAPILPSGYIYGVRVGAMRTDGSANFLRTRQNGARAEYVNGAVSMVTGTNSAWTAIAVGNYVPPTAIQIKGVMSGLSMGNNTTVSVAPSNGYPTGATGSAATTPLSITNSTGAANGLSFSGIFEFNLQTSNIYYASNSGSAATVSAMGWTDKINAN